MTCRCDWASSPMMVEYHDREWGVPVRDERGLLEFLCLEGQQAGLSWAIILRKRDNYRRLFANFEAEALVRYTDADVDRLVQDAGIVRHRGKITAIIDNAKATLALRERAGGLPGLLWEYVDGRPRVNCFERMEEIPGKTPLSDAMSRDLKKRGFRFVGSTTCYAMMQAAGLVNDHLVTCFRHECLSARANI